MKKSYLDRLFRLFRYIFQQTSQSRICQQNVGRFLGEACLRNGARSLTHPIAVGIVISVAVLLLWQSLLVYQHSEITHLIVQETAAVKTELSNRLNRHILGLERMAKRWEANGGTPRRVWEVDAAAYLKDFNGYEAIEWVDATAHVRWIALLWVMKRCVI